MIKLTSGDILTANSEALVNTVNCVGVMGRGIALQFRKAYPANYKVYQAACSRKDVQPGKILAFETGLLTGPRWILNFPTKRHWKGNSLMADIDAGLVDLVDVIKRNRIKSIAIPPLGCGLGGLKWEEVKPRIIAALADLPDLDVVLFEPEGPPPSDSISKTLVRPQMTTGRAVLLQLMSTYLTAVLDPFITLLEIHKLAYFMQLAGEPLRLHFVKATYGPYAENLRHVLSLVDGHFISGYGDAEDNPTKPIQLLPEAAFQASSMLQSNPETLSRLDRVARLIDGFETPYGMELLATVHWVSAQESAASEAAVIHQTYAWNQRKQAFTEPQLRLARQVLIEQNWLTLTPATLNPR